MTLVYRANRPTTVGDYVNTAQGVFGQATTPTASATYRHGTIQALNVTKVSSTISDPVRGTTNPLALTDSLIEYAIGVTNPNTMVMDANTVEIIDPTPALLRMCAIDVGGAGSGPVSFTNGIAELEPDLCVWRARQPDRQRRFFEQWGRHLDLRPQPAGDGCDSAITTFRVKPTGSLAASGRFTLRARYRIN